MTGKSNTISLTIRYLFALGLVAALSIANYRLLRAEIKANESTVELFTLSGRQRTLLQSTALLAQAAVSIFSPEERAPLVTKLNREIDQLEDAHYRLIEFDPIGIGKPLPEVKEIYENNPWTLDIEIRNYLAQLRALANSDTEDMNFLNSHYRYIREVALEGQVIDGLEEVVRAYQAESNRRAELLRQQAISSLFSTLVVLGLSGLFVFRPMVNRVRRDMNALNEINETLEERVAQRTAEAEQRAQDLATSEALYQSLVDTLPLGVARKDLQGRYTYVNRLFTELLETPASQILNATPGDVFSETYAQQSIHSDEQVLAKGRIIQGIREHVLEDGSIRYFEVIKSPVKDSASKILGTQTVLWDITKRRAAEERMLQAERLAAIGEMITGVAHESRNALQQINACAKMLEWEEKLSDESYGLISDIQKAHHRLHRLFENLRGYASPFKMEPRPSQVLEIFAEAWRSTEPDRADRCVNIQHEGIDTETRCVVDSFQIEQVFRNIIENSLAACTDPACILVQWSPAQIGDQPALQIRFADNGPGLTQEAKQKIFEPFFTTRTRGTGLGMAIVKRIVEAHQGEIGVDNTDDGGTIICITLPREIHES